MFFFVFFWQIYNDTGDDSPLHSGNGYNGSDPLTDMTISSETGYIRVMFQVRILIKGGYLWKVLYITLNTHWE
jgi:hypothetical protein